MTTATPTLKPETRTKAKRQPPYAVVVLNDDVHTFTYVIECFIKVFAYTKEKAVLLALLIHQKKRAIVWTGALEVAELKKEQIESMGPDHDAAVECNFPLGVLLEPLPQ